MSTTPQASTTIGKNPAIETRQAQTSVERSQIPIDEKVNPPYPNYPTAKSVN
jgi:hypothetical protein